MKNILVQTKKGFTIFFAMLVGSLALAVGIAIYDLTVREIDLSASASQSQYAIYAADTGVECALYWDSKATPLNGSPSIFGTSSGSTWGGAANCNGQNIVAWGTPPATFVPPDGTWGPWCANNSGPSCPATATAATTTFTLAIYSNTAPPQTYCAKVEVGKTTINNILYTTVISRGYNNCVATGAARLERTLRVSY
jgi:hypothetical protein